MRRRPSGLEPRGLKPNLQSWSGGLLPGEGGPDPFEVRLSQSQPMIECIQLQLPPKKASAGWLGKALPCGEERGSDEKET
jgi:hypothetical protein